MKVLFAIGDNVTSENIVKQYYSLYGEKIEYKDVFYFKALLEEVKRDKTYDRIVISEQLEPPKSNVVDAIDQMIFNNIDSIRDEIEDSTIIFICSDGRDKNNALVGRLFNNCGIYNLLMGDERDIIPLCNLIKEPRTRKEAREYLGSNPTIGGATATIKSEDEVDEMDILNISRYFNNLKTNEEYLKNFASVEEQYNEKQLQTIVTALLKNLRKGREIYETLYMDPRYNKYCIIQNYERPQNKKVNSNSKPSILGFLTGKKAKSHESGPIEKLPDNASVVNNVVGAGVYIANKVKDSIASRVSAEAEEMMNKSQQEAKALSEQLKRESEERRRIEREAEQLKDSQEAQQEAQLRAQQEAQLKAQQEAQLRAQQEAQLKAQQEAQLRAQQEAQLRAQQEAQLRAQQEAQLRAQQEAQLKAQQEAQLRVQQEAQLKAQQEAQLKAQQEAQLKAQQDSYVTPNYSSNEIYTPESTGHSEEYISNTYEPIAQVPQFFVPADYKKVVAFVGTNKVGTSFIVNMVASLMAMKGVKTSILDMTKNRGMYWFYNETAYKKSNIVATCMSNLSNGMPNPIQIGKYKNLDLYTTVPGGNEDNRKAYRHRNMIETAKRNCNLLIIDCDFTTPYEYLEQASEIYIVQDLDLIKVQETKEFLRELKTRKTDWSKLRVVINNNVKCKITSKKIIKNALTYYTDSSMTFTEEFDEIKKYVEIPMEIENYSTYLESMENGKINYDKFTPALKKAIDDLSIMVYGMVPKKKGFFN